MPFEIFTREFVRTTAPKVTITNLGRFSINNAASALLRKNTKIDSVFLFWDKSTNRVGIQPVDQPIKNVDHRAYPLKAYGPKGRSGTGFSAVTFLRFIHYDYSKTHSFPVTWSIEENMLIFAIPKELVGGGGGVPLEPPGIPEKESVRRHRKI